MNELGLIFLGLIARGAAFGLVGLGLGAATRRRGPGLSATVTLATLVGMVGVSVVAALPWARFWTLAPTPTPAPLVRAPETAEVEATDRPEGRVEGGSTVAAGAPTRAIPDRASPVVAAARAFVEAIATRPVSPGSPAWGWAAWVAVGSLGLIAFGLGRFGLGLLAVRMLRRGGARVDDPALNTQLERLRAEVGRIGPVELREGTGLAFPATVGWLRPAIFLPDDWRDWDDHERRVVLAHELAHIRRNDYLAGLWAQLSLALHYDNPLAHGLARRLRLDQELAADALGARLSGGNRPYLATLARMALRHDPRPIGWPARSLRPSKGTLLRRIEMLRDSRESLTPPSPLPIVRVGAIGLLIVAGVALAGVRGPASVQAPAPAPTPSPVIGQAPAAGPAARIDPSYIPADAAMLVALRPAAMLARPEIRDFLAQFGDGMKTLPVPPERVEQVSLIWLQTAFGPGPAGGPMVVSTPSGAVVRLVQPGDLKAIASAILGTPLRETSFGDTPILEPGEPDGPRSGGVAAKVDDRTLLIATDRAGLLRMIRTPPAAVDRAAWAGPMKGTGPGQVFIGIDANWLLSRIDPTGRGGPGANPVFGMFAPILQKSQAIAVGLDLADDLTVSGMIACFDEDGAKRVAETIRAAVVLGRNALEASKSEPAVRPVADGFGSFLSGAEVTADGTNVAILSGKGTKVDDLIKTMLPAVLAARVAARRAQSVNNLKQIGLAMHNYATVNHESFPPAVVIGPDGKTPHSWRVAILPYLEQGGLYNEYHFDQPWDSPANKKVLDHMPAVFGHPREDQHLLNRSSYYALANPQTILGKPGGTALKDITDGLSLSILVVEADRDIPWTKPEDIPVDLSDVQSFRVPKLGGFSPGGFNVVLGDGAVRFISNTIAPMVLRSMMTSNGGEIIDGSTIP